MEGVNADLKFGNKVGGFIFGLEEKYQKHIKVGSKKFVENVLRNFSLLYRHLINSSGLVSGTRLQSTGEMSAKPCDISSSTNSENTNPGPLWHFPKHSKIYAVEKKAIQH